MKYKKLHFSGHATVQMFKRGISVENVETVLLTGKIIKDYPEDKPYPSYLILGFVAARPLHIVVSTDELENCYIVTAYEPDPTIWNTDFTVKK